MSDDEVQGFLRNLEEFIETPDEAFSTESAEPADEPLWCPDCNAELLTTSRADYTVERCFNHGIWLPWNQAHGLLGDLIALRESAEDEELIPGPRGSPTHEKWPELDETIEFLSALEQTPSSSTQEGLVRKCPACRETMRLSYQLGVEVDVCQQHGVWFDRGELKAYVKAVRTRASVREKERWKKILHRGSYRAAGGFGGCGGCGGGCGGGGCGGGGCGGG